MHTRFNVFPMQIKYEYFPSVIKSFVDTQFSEFKMCAHHGTNDHDDNDKKKNIFFCALFLFSLM